MVTRLVELPKGAVFNFRGGLASAKPNTLLDINEALELRNVYVSVGGGLFKRRGNTEFNSSAMVSATSDVVGIGYYKLQTGTDFMMAICGGKIFKSDSLDGTMDDITGALTISTNQNDFWTHSVMNDLSIFVGGAPNAPIKWDGSAGTASVLGGTPPNGRFGFQMNNRFFIGSPDSDRSTIYWSVLADPEDWSGTGSGSSDIYTGDGDTLVGHAILNNDIVLLFKQNSIHQLIVQQAPFPVFPLFQNIGAVSTHGIVVADGLVYFITPRGKMAVTDGTQILSQRSLPKLHNIDDVWEGLNSTRYQYIWGARHKGRDFDHIVWLCSDGTATENDLAIVWDIRNQCWLKHTSGFNANVAMETQDRKLYTGHYDGKIYEQDVDSVYSDASETDSSIDGYWATGWTTRGTLQESIRPFRLNLTFLSQQAGALTVGYGFDFNGNSKLNTMDMTPGGSIWGAFTWGAGTWGGQDDIIRHIFMRGRGNALQLTFRNNIDGENFQIHGYTISGVPAGQKLFQVT